MLARPKQDEDKTPVMSTSLNPFDLVPKTQGFLEIVAQANWKKKKQTETWLPWQLWMIMSVVILLWMWNSHITLLPLRVN